MSLNWSPSAKFCAGSAHMGWAAAVVVAASYHNVQLWLTIVLFATYSVAKEFWADLSWLEHDTVAGSVFDFVTYCIGLGIGVLSLYYFLVSVFVAVGVLVIMGIADADGILMVLHREIPKDYY